MAMSVIVKPTDDSAEQRQRRRSRPKLNAADLYEEFYRENHVDVWLPFEDETPETWLEDENDYSQPNDDVPHDNVPDLSEAEWAQVLDAMTTEEWQLFLALRESELDPSEDDTSFALHDSFWPRLGPTSVSSLSTVTPNGPAAPSMAVLAQDDSDQEEDYELVERVPFHDDNNATQRWIMLSNDGKETDDSIVLSWCSLPLTFREALLGRLPRCGCE